MNKNVIKIITILFLIMIFFNTTVEASSVVSDIKSNMNTSTIVSNSVKWKNSIRSIKYSSYRYCNSNAVIYCHKIYDICT